MRTDPTASVNGPAATSLSYHAIESGKQTARQAVLKSKAKTAISDTVETGDREGDGRENLQFENGESKREPSANSNPPSGESGGQLDLTG